MRHAKSDWNAEYEADHDRPLNARGVRSARVMGEVLSRAGIVPKEVISSTAVRARSTAELAIEAGSWESDLILEPKLYGTGPNTAMAVAAQAPSVDRLMLVGHQPAWSMLVLELTGESAQMKTATVAVVEIPGDDWSAMGAGRCELTGVLQPPDYLGSRSG